MARYLILSFLIFISLPISAQKQLAFIDKAYEPTIKTIMMYPNRGSANNNSSISVTSIQENNLVLEFDELKSNRSDFYAKLIHCNYDWTKSTLSDLDFSYEYNEYNITDYAFSGNTLIPYVHYRFDVPPVKIPGNYLLIVYRDGNKNQLVLSKRLMIFAPQIRMINDRQFLGTGAGRTIQPFNFTLNYSGIEIFNPLQSVHLVMMQNHRWDNVKTDINPSFIRESSSELEYRFFDEVQSFQGGNEFRFVDFRSVNFPGQNTGSVDRSVRPFHLYVAEDRPRTDQVYSQYNDFNGNFLIDNRDTGDSKTGSNYLNVTFTLKPFKKYSEPIFVLGAFNQWSLSEENEMKYNINTASFEKTFLLKQGLYNYTYVIQSPNMPASEIEGDHFETENMYEIFVYNRSFHLNADLLLGYFVFSTNPR
jgi:hypothetical protein